MRGGARTDGEADVAREMSQGGGCSWNRMARRERLLARRFGANYLVRVGHMARPEMLRYQTVRRCSIPVLDAVPLLTSYLFSFFLREKLIWKFPVIVDLSRV